MILIIIFFFKTVIINHYFNFKPNFVVGDLVLVDMARYTSFIIILKHELLNLRFSFSKKHYFGTSFRFNKGVVGQEIQK